MANIFSFVGYNGGSRFNTKYYICNYGEGGNFQGKPIFIAGDPCSICPSGTICRKGLCSANTDEGAEGTSVDEEVPEGDCFKQKYEKLQQSLEQNYSANEPNAHLNIT